MWLDPGALPGIPCRMRCPARPLLLLLVCACSLLACSKSHGAQRAGSDGPNAIDQGDGEERDDTDEDGDEPGTGCPARGSRRAVDRAEYDLDDAWQSQDTGGRQLLAFSYTPPLREDSPPRETLAALQ